MPLSLRQAVSLDQEGLISLYRRVAQAVPCRVPNVDYSNVLRRLTGAEPPTMQQSDREFLERSRAIGARLRRSLEGGRYRWRTLERLALEAAVTEELAADILRADDEVRFSEGKSGRTIVGLVSRVGNG
jgi:hypothetical protein